MLLSNVIKISVGGKKSSNGRSKTNDRAPPNPENLPKPMAWLQDFGKCAPPPPPPGSVHRRTRITLFLQECRPHARTYRTL